MKNRILRTALFVVTFLAALATSSCVQYLSKSDEYYEWDKDYSRDGAYTYDLLKVLQIDPINPDGINIVSKLNFLSTYKMTLFYENGTLVAAQFDKGDCPFSPVRFDIPEGKFEVYFDDSSSPYVMREKATDKILATFIRGQFYMPFQLDSANINYEFWFKAAK